MTIFKLFVKLSMYSWAFTESEGGGGCCTLFSHLRYKARKLYRRLFTEFDRHGIPHVFFISVYFVCSVVDITVQ
jgi:hypothetical protein